MNITTNSGEPSYSGKDQYFFFASAVQSYLSALNERLEFVVKFFGLAG